MLRISSKLIAISLLSASSIAISMDKDFMHRDIVVQKISAVENPVRIEFLNKKDSLIVQDEYDIHEVNWKQNTVTGKMAFTNLPERHRFWLPKKYLVNPQGNAVGAYRQHKLEDGTPLALVERYDVTKQEVTWTLPLIGFDSKQASLEYTFTPSGKLYVFDQKGSIYCDDGKKYLLDTTERHITNVTADSTEEKIIFADYNGSRSDLHTISFDEKSRALYSGEYAVNGEESSRGPNFLQTKLTPKQPITPHVEKNALNPFFNNWKRIHSPISKLIALYSKSFWVLFDLEARKEVEAAQEILKNCCALAFHPKEESLLAILTKDGSVILYDHRKNKIIAQTNNPLGISKRIKKSCIQFSKNGETIGLIINKMLFVLSNLYQKND